MHLRPLRVEKLGTRGIRLHWSDGLVQELTSELLRTHCPSAISKAKAGDESHEKPLTAKKKSLQVLKHSAEEELRLEKIWAVGNYALGMRFGDGHDSGIFSFELLRSLGSAGL